MLKTTSRDEFFDATFIEGLTDNICPSYQLVSKFIINLVDFFHLVEDNLLLNLQRRIFLFNSDGETLKERIVKNLGRHKLTIVRTTTLGVRRSDDIEPCFGENCLTSFLVEVWFTFKDCLKTHHLVRTTVDFVKDEDSTTLHSSENWTFTINNVTVDEGVTTNQVVFISFDGDVNTHAFALQLGTDLLNHGGLTVTRQTRDERWVEVVRLHNLREIAIETEGDIGRVNLWDKVFNHCLQLRLDNHLRCSNREFNDRRFGTNHQRRQVIRTTLDHTVALKNPPRILHPKRFGSGNNFALTKNTIVGVIIGKELNQSITIHHKNILTSHHHLIYSLYLKTV